MISGKFNQRWLRREKAYFLCLHHACANVIFRTAVAGPESVMVEVNVSTDHDHFFRPIVWCLLVICCPQFHSAIHLLTCTVVDMESCKWAFVMITREEWIGQHHYLYLYLFSQLKRRSSSASSSCSMSTQPWVHGRWKSSQIFKRGKFDLAKTFITNHS